MKNVYPFHSEYARAITSGNVSALQKLINRALRAKPQKEFFTGDKTGKPLTHFENLVTAVWRTFDSGHIDHVRLFLAAGLPADILLPGIDGASEEVMWTPLDVALTPGDGDQEEQFLVIQALLAAGANPQRKIWGPDYPKTITASQVRTLGAARLFWEFGVPVEAFVSLHPHLRARL